jgi:uracil-DNA glycosylase
MNLVDWFTKTFGTAGEEILDYDAMSDSALLAQATSYAAMLDEMKPDIHGIIATMQARGIDPVGWEWTDYGLGTSTGTGAAVSQDAKPEHSGQSGAEPPSVPYATGPEDAPVAFVGASLSPTDKARREHLTGPGGETLRDLYLDALSMGRGDVVLASLVPEFLTDERGKPREPTAAEIESHSEAFWKAMDELKPRSIVALGKTARNALGDSAVMWLPHPIAVRMNGDRGEVGRKTRQLRERLKKTVEAAKSAPTVQHFEATILKSDDEKQLITGIVLEPFTTDSQGDVMEPGEIEKAAHFYLTQSRVVGDEHSELAADVQVVESFTAPDDLTIGDQPVKKGTWVMTVHVADPDRWAQVKQGGYTGFSVGGFGTRIPMEDVT